MKSVKFIPKYTGNDILRVLQESQQKLASSDIQRMASNELGMSPRTLWNLWTDEVKKSPLVFQDGRFFSVHPDAIIPPDPVIEEVPPAPKGAKPTFKNSKAFQVATLMPRGLSHYPNKPEPFDIYRSETVSWLMTQPEILSYLWSKIANSGAIAFDQSSQTYGGINADSNRE